MIEGRNPNVKISFPDTAAFDSTVVNALGIDPTKAMLGAAARAFDRDGTCAQLICAIIARDEETYDWIVSQGESLKLPVPSEMISDAIDRHQRSVRKKLQPANPDSGPTGGVGTFSACCSKSKDVTLVMVGEVETTTPGKPGTDIRFVVGDGLAVKLTMVPNVVGPSGFEVVKSAEFDYRDNFKTCRETP